MSNKDLDPPGSAIDEALWAANRRDDKTAVMDYLFGRNLVGIGCSGSSRSKKSSDARHANGGAVLINGGPRQIQSRYAVN